MFNEVLFIVGKIIKKKQQLRTMCPSTDKCCDIYSKLCYIHATKY